MTLLYSLQIKIVDQENWKDNMNIGDMDIMNWYEYYDCEYYEIAFWMWPGFACWTNIAWNRGSQKSWSWSLIPAVQCSMYSPTELNKHKAGVTGQRFRFA